ncbi:Cro/CI family transcriptional regulator [Hydrogenophaga sp.]|uniref:Cro/CI family transcriptional regulator n=1 Tax=Hydrogenophaga sp. TaxID=1904254 RepID=UPI0035255288
MKTQHAIQLAGSAKALADLLEITGGAISQWGEDLPKGRSWQLQLLRPEWFKPGAIEALGGSVTAEPAATGIAAQATEQGR